MNRRLIVALAAAAAAAGLSAAAAANAAVPTVSQNFDVKVALTAVCLTNNATPTAVDFGTYTAFGSASTPAPTTVISFKCSKNVTISSVTLDGATPSVAGLTYGLTVGGDSQSSVSDYTVHSYTLTGSMTAGQAGDTAAATTQTRTLTIAY